MMARSIRVKQTSESSSCNRQTIANCFCLKIVCRTIIRKLCHAEDAFEAHNVSIINSTMKTTGKWKLQELRLSKKKKKKKTGEFKAQEASGEKQHKLPAETKQ